MATWLIEITDLNGMSKAETTEYIATAIRAWANGSSPDHPFFGSFLNTERDGVLHVRELTANQAKRVNKAMGVFD